MGWVIGDYAISYPHMAALFGTLIFDRDVSTSRCPVAVDTTKDDINFKDDIIFSWARNRGDSDLDTATGGTAGII